MSKQSARKPVSVQLINQCRISAPSLKNIQKILSISMKVLVSARICKKTHLEAVILSKSQIADINWTYRNVHGPTDVLTFAPCEFAHKNVLGEIILCPSTIREHAREENILYQEELMRVCIHGVLHLCGYDHVKRHERKQMFRLQEATLKSLLKNGTKRTR